jgi:hypothetical protein
MWATGGPRSGCPALRGENAMRIGRFVMVAALTAGLVVLSSYAGSTVAQQKGKGKGGFGGFGFGGFGGPGSLTTAVLNNKALQEELKVSPEQQTKLKPAAEMQKKLQDKMAEAFKDAGGDFQKMQEIGTKLNEERLKVVEETKKAVEETLSADQKTRLKQIEVQQAGPMAFANEETVKDLKLTDAQKNKIKGINDEFTKDSREAFAELRGGGFDQDKMAEVNRKVDKLRAAALTQIQEALSDDQKKTWKTLVGEPFDVAKLRPQFRKID